MNLKQVIVMRNDLNMRKGKMIVQGSHASMGFLRHGPMTEVQRTWLDSEEHKKVCVQVSSEDELWSIRDAAECLGLPTYVVADFGLTEFKGQQTNTCLAIGPAESDDIDKITGHLKLL